MSRSDHRKLISMGRKAGLRTTEIYSALSNRRPSVEDVNAAARDGNGFRAGVDASGHAVYEDGAVERPG